jgi:hypothetical protein
MKFIPRQGIFNFMSLDSKSRTPEYHTVCAHENDKRLFVRQWMINATRIVTSNSHTASAHTTHAPASAVMSKQVLGRIEYYHVSMDTNNRSLRVFRRKLITGDGDFKYSAQYSARRRCRQTLTTSWRTARAACLRCPRENMVPCTCPDARKEDV